MAPGPDDRDAVLDLVLRPHRSLSPAGFRAVMAMVAGFSFVAGIVFWSLGAWPVMGFLGLEALLVYIAFRASYAEGRIYERIRLSTDSLVIERVNAAGRHESFSLQPYWLRVELADEPAPENHLRVWSHGRAYTVGAFLPPEERAEVAGILRAGLARIRSP
ncbi:MAG TPA: DUF2244 domain-containing protein [Alphaproteobacteria bacterium]